MNKISKTFALTALLLSLTVASNGQIFETEDVKTSRYGVEQDPYGIIPLNGGTYDQTNEIFTPLGDGIMLLAALGGSYLLGKRNKKEKKDNNK